MQLDAIVHALHYTDSPNYILADQLARDPENGFLYRRAHEECGLVGAYLLRPSVGTSAGTPVVYVCRAKSEEQARLIHQRVWNQDIVPFLLVISPRTLRIYPGFRFDRLETGNDDPDAGALRIFQDFNKGVSELASFRADAIDKGQLWREWASEVTPETRVDWRLLRHLRELGKWLGDSGVEDHALIHGIIGKFVYLRYLRDREILSPRKLQTWNLDEADVLSRDLNIQAFERLLAHLDDWLNGSVFPLSRTQLQKLGQSRLRTVAGVFRGDAASGQMALDFANYDFSFIPIETLSVIYEQFLHVPDPQTGISKGRQEGAYYTPVPVVNFMLDRLEAQRPLKPGMRVLDPSCGSGVFLVQCYRRLIEQVIWKNNGNPPKPKELSGLLTEHLFGIDTDIDACQIAELSLVLTLLDYVKPPDLESARVRAFHLPSLREKNIFHRSAFAPVPDAAVGPFDCIVGNPPWRPLDPRGAESADDSLDSWARESRTTRPTGGLQIAELFAWRSLELLRSDGVASLLMPAMTLFKYESKKFRRRFFSEAAVWEVANFANLANVLFGGRSTVPAAAWFFRKAQEVQQDPITVYAPFLANQPVLYDVRTGEKQKELWSMVVNVAEVRSVRYSDALSGESLPWKLASWGSFLDRNLLEQIKKQFPSIQDLEKSGAVVVATGFELRKTARGKDRLEHHPELVGKRQLLTKKLKERRYLYRFPKDVVRHVAEDEAYVRRRGGYEVPLLVCRPPHVLVARSGAFAVYDEDFLIIPPRQPAIAGTEDKKSLLKALALYLNSDFALYYQFLSSPEAGIQKTIGTLRELRTLPIPFTAKANENLQDWVDLHNQIARQNSDKDDFSDSPLIVQLNDLVNESLKLDSRSKALVHDLIHVKLDLTRGKVGRLATAAANKGEFNRYGVVLKNELDGFLGNDIAARHRVRIAVGEDAAVVEVFLVRDTRKAQALSVEPASSDLSVELTLARSNARERWSQWFYFNRSLRVYDGTSTFLCKPTQRMQWTHSQALLDAGEIIADTLALPAEDMATRG